MADDTSNQQPQQQQQQPDSLNQAVPKYLRAKRAAAEQQAVSAAAVPTPARKGFKSSFASTQAATSTQIASRAKASSIFFGDSPQAPPARSAAVSSGLTQTAVPPPSKIPRQAATPTSHQAAAASSSDDITSTSTCEKDSNTAPSGKLTYSLLPCFCKGFSCAFFIKPKFLME